MRPRLHLQCLPVPAYHRAGPVATCNTYYTTDTYCLFGVNEMFMLVLEIEACKRPRNDLTSCQRHRNDPSV